MKETKQLMSLLVCYGDERQPEEPMGEPEIFDNIIDFIQYNVEQATEILDSAPQYETVIHNLLTGNFKTNKSDDVMYVVVTV